jgi:hypothetical protein
MSSPRSAAPWSATSPSSTTATRSTAAAWAPAATASPPSASPTSSSSRMSTPSSSSMSRRTPSGNASTRTASGRSTTASSPRAPASRPRGVRRLLHRLNKELNLPIILPARLRPLGALHLQRSSSRAPSPSRSSPNAWRSPTPSSWASAPRTTNECGLSDDVKIDLNDRDIDRAKQIAAYPWFADNKGWQKEIKKMLDNGFKMEVEGADHQGHLLCDRGVCAGEAQGEGLAGVNQQSPH